MGMFFNSFFRHADVVKMANLAQLVNVIAPIMTNKQGLFLQPIYFPIVEYGKQRGNMALQTWVSSPTYSLNRQQLPLPGHLGHLQRQRSRGIRERLESTSRATSRQESRIRKAR